MGCWKCSLGYEKRKKNKMKRVLIAVLALFSAHLGSAQQDAQFSQNMFLNNVFNPGAAGIKGMHCFSLVGRDQYTSFEGHPFTGLLSYSGVSNHLPNFGFGAVMVYDKIGFEQNLNFKLNGAYHITVGDKGGKLGLGLDLGILQKGITGNVVASNPNDPIVANISGTSDMGFDLGVGAFYYVPNQLYFGISGQKLLPQKVQLGDAEPELRQHAYVMAGYSHPVGNFTLKPSTLVKTDLASTQMDVNLTAEYNHAFWLGGSYRVQESVVANVGYYFYAKDKNGNKKGEPWKVGLAYDFTVNALRKEGQFTVWGDNNNVTGQESNRSMGAVELYIGKCIIPPPIPDFKTYVDPLFL